MSGVRLARHLAIPLLAASVTMLVITGNSASAGIVPTVGLATSGNYSVLGATTVTNTGPSVLGQSLGLSPGTATPGFPPGMVLPPGTTDVANAVSLQAQNDLIAAYTDAANRPVEFTQTNPDLVGLTLAPGVYAGSSKAPLSLSGQLILDGQGNNAAVFIFQTDSTLITSSASSILLINGASECNIFWQVGSSATLGTGSQFVGNILGPHVDLSADRRHRARPSTRSQWRCHLGHRCVHRAKLHRFDLDSTDHDCRRSGHDADRYHQHHASQNRP